MPAIEAQKLEKRYGATVVLNDLSFAIEKGAFAVALGPSASGKTTLLRLIAGLETPDAGSIHLHGRCVSGDGVHVHPLRRGIGMVFQDHALWPHMAVRDHLRFVLKATRLTHGQRAEQIERLLDIVELTEWAEALPHTLSGGQQQRLGIARALALNPRILLMDEPFASLDERLRSRILAELRRRQEEDCATVLVATHEIAELESAGIPELQIIPLKADLPKARVARE